MSRKPKAFKQFVHVDDNPPRQIVYEVHIEPRWSMRLTTSADHRMAGWRALHDVSQSMAAQKVPGCSRSRSKGGVPGAWCVPGQATAGKSDSSKQDPAL